MEKDAYYFPHFSNARHDRKIKRITKELGVEGYGIFFMILEVLREQTSLKYPMSDIDLLAYEFGTSEQKVRTVICNYGLFDIDQDEMFYSKKLSEYLKPYFTMKRQRKEAAESRWAKEREIKSLEEPKELQSDSESNTGLMRPHSDRITTEMQSKVKESKVKESKEKIEMPFSSSEFLSIWEDWKEYKSKEFNFKFKSSQSEKASLTQLCNISNNDEATAIKIVQNSMAKGWKGFFPLSESQTTSYSQNGHSSEIYGLPIDFKIEVPYFKSDPKVSPYPRNKETNMYIKGEKYIFDNPYKSERYHVDEQGRITKTEELTEN